MENKKGNGIDRLLAIVSRLRGEGGCPWDREQTLKTLKKNLIEETYEVIDSIDLDNSDNHEEELGDLLLQVVLQSQIQKEEGNFTFNDVADRISDKLIHRHPHVFGNVKVQDSEEVLRNWESIKTKEKKNHPRSVIEGIPRHLPGLQKAQRVQSKVSRVGFDWKDLKDVMAKVEEELAEVKEAIAKNDTAEIKEEIGDLLFAVVNLSRFLHVDAEEAIGDTIAKFIMRFKEIERRIHKQGRELTNCSLAEIDACWEDIKKEE